MEGGNYSGIRQSRHSWQAAMLCALIMIAGPLFWSWWLEPLTFPNHYHQKNNPPAKGREARRAEACAMTSGYAPNSEQPQVLRVNNPTTLASLQIAQPGDMVLVYRQSGVMLLYDPLTDRILNRAAFQPGFPGNF